MKELIQYAQEGVHSKVLNFMKESIKGKVLDIPAGQGALSSKLEEMGFKAFLGDIQRENLLYHNGRCVQMDLNYLLPFKNQIFDYVVCIEGIEHIENPHLLIHECARVLKKDGILILSTPNVMTIKSRWRFLFYSYLDYFRYFGPVPPSERHQIQEYDHQHINPLFYGELKWILEKEGLRIKKIETNRLVRKKWIIYPLVKWIVRYKTKRKFPEEPVYISDNLLGGEILILFAQKGKD